MSVLSEAMLNAFAECLRERLQETRGQRFQGLKLHNRAGMLNSIRKLGYDVEIVVRKRKAGRNAPVKWRLAK